jgi:hypothetical protein
MMMHGPANVKAVCFFLSFFLSVFLCMYVCTYKREIFENYYELIMSDVTQAILEYPANTLVVLDHAAVSVDS